MHEIGIVTRIDGMMARVRMEKKSACSHCEQDSCDITEGGVETDAINIARARVGQKVKVVMRSQAFMKGAIFLYIFPLTALFLGAIAGKIYLPAYFPETGSDLLSALGGIAAFLVSVVLLIVLSKTTKQNKEFQSVIEEILE